MTNDMEADPTSIASTQPEVAALAWALDALVVETPSWGYTNSGTRFRVFPQSGVPRNTMEKIDDAATVARFTGVARDIALHIPWDHVDDYPALAAYAVDRGLRVGAINSNTFQDDDYKLGSICHPDARVRRKAIEHLIDCCRIARLTGSQTVKVWLGDGTNYPGQDDFRRRRHLLIESLTEVHGALPPGADLLIEYKLFEPAFYHTDVQDWGQALSVCRLIGPQARVCVDIGHHAQGTNVEQIVAILLQEGRLGGIDLNDRKYADDDLMVGSIDPYQLFRVCHELVKALMDQTDRVAAGSAQAVRYMLDQSHNIEPKMPAVIRSVMNLQEAFAKALTVDHASLEAFQREGSPLEANRIVTSAFATDVRGLLAEARLARGLPADPYRAYLESGEEEGRTASRGG